MIDGGVDILMISYNRPAYTALALDRLLASCDQSMRVWLWHNGEHAQTLSVVQERASHPAVHRFHHSKENRKLREASNWVMREGQSAYYSKVDDDCLVPDGWAQTLCSVLSSDTRLGALACWHFMPEDFDPKLSAHKIRRTASGSEYLGNCWVQGSGFILKRDCIRDAGLIAENETFTSYCIRLARRGWRMGWHLPIIWEEHMDDPRAPHCGLTSDAEFQASLPLSARNFGSSSVKAWEAQLRRSARTIQTAPDDPRVFHPWRVMARRSWGRVAKKLGLAAPAW